MNRTGISLALAALLAGCQTIVPPVQTTSVAALYQLPAERALVDGIRQYEEAHFEVADALLRKALGQGLGDRRDAAVAHKYIAFIACAFGRLTDCEASFRDAFAADPKFSLVEAEIGHPVWGPVYRRVAADQPKR